MGDKNKKSALQVNDGIDTPPQVNKDAAERFSNIRSDDMPAADYVKGIISGNRTLLSKAITLIESALPKHHILAQEIISGCLPHAGNSIRVGITGVPGVGKSTFVETLGKQLTSSGHKVAVLAIDPSSTRSKGWPTTRMPSSVLLHQQDLWVVWLVRQGKASSSAKLQGLIAYSLKQSA